MFQEYAIQHDYSHFLDALKRDKDYYHKDPERMTPGQLFQTIIELMQQDGHFDEASYILDYVSPESMDRQTLCNYQFDIIAYPNKGGSEGVYVDVILNGIMDGSGKNKRLQIGVLKTLKEGLGAYTIMGKLAGAFVFYADRFINTNLHLFMPEAELAEYKKRKADLHVTTETEQPT